MSYVDIAILALVVLFAVIGVLRGIKKSTLAFGAFLVAFVISFFLAKVVAEALLGIEAIRMFVIGKDGFSLYTWLNGSIVISEGNSVMFAGETAPSDFISDNFFAPMIELVGGYALSESFTISNAVALCSAFTVFTAIVGVGLFIVVRVLLCLVTMIIKALIGRKKSWLGRLGGFGVGILRGACWSIALTIVLSTIGGFTFNGAIGKIESEYERGVISPYVNRISYSIKNKLLLPDLDMFSRIVAKSGLVLKDEDVNPEHDIAGYERDLYIDFMNLNYKDTAYSYDSATGKITFNDQAHKREPSDFETSGFDAVVQAIMTYNETAANKIRTDRVLKETESSTLLEYKTTLSDSSNSIYNQWTQHILTDISNYESKIEQGLAQTSQAGKEEANNVIKTAYNNLVARFETLKTSYAAFGDVFGALEFEMPEVYVIPVE